MTKMDKFSKESLRKKRIFRNLNIILTNLIILSLIILCIRYNFFDFSIFDNEPEELPLRGQKIINTHEHINNMDLLNNFLKSQRQCNVSAIIMVGSPSSTFRPDPKGPFIKYLENNELIIEMTQKTNSEIIAFPTLNPNDGGNLERLKDYISRGARGLNLWTGHHGTLEGSWGKTTLYDWLGPLNRTDMYPIYEYCQENRVPIVWSNNLGVRDVREQLWQILEKFPDMIIKISHFGICFRSYNLPFIKEFLDKYEGGYTCFPWGHPEYVMEKFENISTVRNEVTRDFFIKYQDRIMFGTDLVPTNHPRKTIEWMRRHTQAYIDIIEREEYHVEIYDFTSDGRDFVVDYRGLNLSKDISEKVYNKNAMKFLNGKKWNESLDDEGNSTLREFDGHHYKVLNEISMESKGLVILVLTTEKRKFQRFFNKILGLIFFIDIKFE